jgi:hypothetical protein
MPGICFLGGFFSAMGWFILTRVGPETHTLTTQLPFDANWLLLVSIVLFVAMFVTMRRR